MGRGETWAMTSQNAHVFEKAGKNIQVMEAKRWLELGIHHRLSYASEESPKVRPRN